MRLKGKIKTILQEAEDYDEDAITHRWIIQSHAAYTAQVHRANAVTFTCLDTEESLMIHLDQAHLFPWGQDVEVMDWMDKQHRKLARA